MLLKWMLRHLPSLWHHVVFITKINLKIWRSHFHFREWSEKSEHACLIYSCLLSQRSSFQQWAAVMKAPTSEYHSFYLGVTVRALYSPLGNRFSFVVETDLFSTKTEYQVGKPYIYQSNSCLSFVWPLSAPLSRIEIQRSMSTSDVIKLMYLCT